MNQSKTIINNFNEIDKNLLNYPITLIHMNIRSLRKHFVTFLTHIKNIKHKTQLIILTETNISDEENNLYQIHGYSATFLNRGGRGGGIAVFVNECVNVETTTLHINSFESMRVDITTTNNRVITVLPVYRPPSHNVKTFLEELETCINNINKKQELIIVGDMNIDINTKSTTATNYLDMLSSNGLHCMVTETTREDVSNKKSTCIDHFFLRYNKSNVKAHAVVVTTTISDHYALFGCIDRDNKNNKSKQIIKGTDYIKTNNTTVNRLIRETNWCAIVSLSNGTNDLFNNIYKAFCDIYTNARYVNNKTLKKRNEYKWLSEELLKLCNVRDKLHKKWQQNKNNKTNEKIYKTFNNKLNKKIIYAKNAYNLKQFVINRNNIRGTWKLINEITGKNVDNIDRIIKRNFSSVSIQDVTDNFALKFNENVKKIVHVCDIKTITNTETVMPNTMYLDYTNELEINNILKGLNIRKSEGADGIRAIDLKNNADYLTSVITTLINSSLRESTIPDLLKTSLIRPIFKSGTKTDYNNYRPIAILPIIEKVLEEIVVRRLNDFLNKYDLINKNQYGFQKGKNINKLLGLFSNHINQNLSKNMSCLALFIDFSKAFDTLSHEKLVNVLERSGIRGHSINWFKNYLQCRSFRVKIDKNLSKNTMSTHGVPQGSKLGPILYIIFANDMLNALKDSKAFAYADDTAIVVSHNSIQSAIRTMQCELNNITRWCHDSGLIVNASKTKLMHFRPRHIQQANISLIFHNTECLHKNGSNLTNDTCMTQIELVNTYKYLGVHLDSQFKWKIHIENLEKKLRKSSYALYHLGNCSPFSVLKQAYFSLVESYLRHGISAWGNASYCRTLQLAQDRFLKLLHKNQQRTITFQNNLNANNTTTNNLEIHARYATSHNINDLYKDFKILNIKCLYKTTIINEFHDNRDFLDCINHEQNTRRRAQGRYKIPNYKNDYGKYSLAVELPSTLNQLPLYLINIRNNYSRKKLIKKHFLE